MATPCFTNTNYGPFIQRVAELEAPIEHPDPVGSDSVEICVKFPRFDDQLNSFSPVSAVALVNMNTSHLLTFQDLDLDDYFTANCTDVTTDCDRDNCCWTIPHWFIFNHTDDVVDNQVTYKLCTLESIDEKNPAQYKTRCQTYKLDMPASESASLGNDVMHVESLFPHFYDCPNGIGWRIDQAKITLAEDQSGVDFDNLETDTPDTTITVVKRETKPSGIEEVIIAVNQTVECCHCCNATNGEIEGETHKSQCPIDGTNFTITGPGGEIPLIFTSSSALNVVMSGGTTSFGVIMGFCTGPLPCASDSTVYQVEITTINHHVTLQPIVDAFTLDVEIVDLVCCGYDGDSFPYADCSDAPGNKTKEYIINSVDLIGQPDLIITQACDANGCSFDIVTENFATTKRRCDITISFKLSKTRRRRRYLLSQLVENSGEVSGTTSNRVALASEETEANMAFPHSCTMAISLMVAVAAIIF